MIVYNTTYTLETAIQHEWLYWVRTDYLPALMETGHIASSRVLRIVSDVGQQGVILSIQLDFADSNAYDTFMDTYAHTHHERMRFRFGNKIASFSTLLEEVWSSAVQ